MAPSYADVATNEQKAFYEKLISVSGGMQRN